MTPRHSPPTDLFEQYVVAVTARDLTSLFAVGDPVRDLDPFREYTDLIFRSEVHQPTPFR
jgi:hypothetical protein